MKINISFCTEDGLVLEEVNAIVPEEIAKNESDAAAWLLGIIEGSVDVESVED